MAIKQSIHRLHPDFDLESLSTLLFQNGFSPLPVTLRHASLARRLPYST
jgi:PIN domain nuclease of toxin-antitoxin system